ncbi:hypothetical protein BH10PSE17_BH10PSE17_00880 [soil metagenome]
MNESFRTKGHGLSSRSIVVGAKTRRAALPLALVAIVMVMSGCASLNKSDCLKGDWVAIGKSDAWAGWPPSRVDAHVEACAKYAVQPDRTLYGQGYRQGLGAYCTFSKGFDVGRFSHDDYYGQCPPQAEGAFLAGRDLGSDAYAIDSEITRLDNSIREFEQQYKDKSKSDSDRNDARRQMNARIRERDGRYTDLERLVDRARARGYK